MADKREGKRKWQKRRWDDKNMRTVCLDCGALIWIKTHMSGYCKSCITKRRPRSEDGKYFAGKAKR